MAGRISEYRQCQMKLLYDHHQEEEKRRSDLRLQLWKIESEVAAYVSGQRLMPCLVRRSPGAQRTVYHSADAPCGYVTNASNFLHMSESEARDADDYQYLARCGSCQWSQAARRHARRLLDGENSPAAGTQAAA